MNMRNIVLEIFPSADDKEIDFLAFECTSYPFDGAKEGQTTEDYFRIQLREYKSVIDAGLTPCDLCNKPAVENEKWTNHCQECIDALNKIRINRGHNG